MAGHSKWANIRHRKGAQDAKRGKLFTKLIREISVAARSSGGGDPESNPALRQAIDKALAANMKKDSIENTVKKATGDLEGITYESMTYEGYGPGGTAILVECLSDNRNRTVAEVRHAFTKAGSALAAEGSVSYLFSKLGLLSFPASVDEDNLMEAALDAGAEDVITHDDGSIDVQTTPEDFGAVREALIAAGFEPEHAAITMQASTQAELDAKDAEKMLRLIERLEDLDDVQDVHSNADISEEILEQIA